MNNIFLMGELFCGPGGMALGAKMSAPQKSKSDDLFSISHLWGVDKDIDAIATYNANNLGEGVKCDAMDFVGLKQNSKHKTILDFDQINALAFGFPCNDFSKVGKKKGFQGKFGNLYKAGIKAIEHVNPKWFIAENVSGIHSANSGKTFIKILSELEASGEYGYNLTVNKYKFEDYGVPQYRHRYIIVGIRKDQNFIFKVPAPINQNAHISVKEALSKVYKNPIFDNDKIIHSSRIEERLLFTPPWHNAWFLDKIMTMSAQERRAELTKAPWYNKKIKALSDQDIVNRISACKLNCKRAKMSHIYRRLHPDKPSYTITGSGGGGTFVYHWEECRSLTNRERARLQSFPDSFVFKGGIQQIRKQIGMAVPPVGAKIIFDAILKTFAGINYDYVDANYKKYANVN